MKEAPAAAALLFLAELLDERFLVVNVLSDDLLGFIL
jgi:hypothetical protein